MVRFLDQKIGPFSGLPIWRPIVRPENEPIFWSRKWTKIWSVFCASWAGFPGPRARKTDVTRARKLDQKLGPFSAPWDCFSVPRALGFSSSLRPGAACPGSRFLPLETYFSGQVWARPCPWFWASSCVLFERVIIVIARQASA